jgi:hypothetical protein
MAVLNIFRMFAKMGLERVRATSDAQVSATRVDTLRGLATVRVT